MIYLSTPFSRDAANRLEEMDISCYKIGSGECNNYPLIEHIASFGKPIILSTGMNDIKSISRSVKILEKSKLWAMQLAEELKYVGTLCVEFFIDRNENLYVNEIAPRVHNSGHLTINAYNISQFENHVRAVCQLDKIELKKISNAEMINVIGKEITNYQNKKFSKNEFFFDYLKETIKDKRKMGHLTILKD